MGGATLLLLLIRGDDASGMPPFSATFRGRGAWHTRAAGRKLSTKATDRMHFDDLESRGEEEVESSEEMDSAFGGRLESKAQSPSLHSKTSDRLHYQETDSVPVSDTHEDESDLDATFKQDGKLHSKNAQPPLDSKTGGRFHFEDQDSREDS